MVDNPFNGGQGAPIRLDPSAGNDLAKLARALKGLGDGKEIPKEFRKALRTGATPALARAKAAALAIPSKQNGGRRGLRAAMARAMSVQIKLGGPDARVAIRVSNTGEKGIMPRLFNRSGGWSHQVYGNENNIVHQTGSPGWYDNAMIASGPEVRDELLKVLKQFEDKLR